MYVLIVVCVAHTALEYVSSIVYDNGKKKKRGIFI